MRDHRLVDEVIISPPWCVTVNVMGHTFPKQKESFVPLCKWQSTNMVFPPISSLTQSVYRTCLLTNEGVNPIHYSFSADPTQVFSCKPNVDLVRGRFQLVLFRMNAMDYGTNRRNVECKMNNMEKFTEKFEMVMTAEKPDVVISPKDMLYFKPTCIGSVSHQTVSITNRSRIPLRYDDHHISFCMKGEEKRNHHYTTRIMVIPFLFIKSYSKLHSNDSADR